MTVMGEQHNVSVDPDCLGQWVGQTFVFEEPFVVLDANCPACTIPDGVTRDDVVHAMINPIHAEHRAGPELNQGE